MKTQKNNFSRSIKHLLVIEMNIKRPEKFACNHAAS